MSAAMRYIELFAGAGGLSMGLEAAGMVPVAHAEIEPHARAVLRHHWPDTPLHGDVTQVDWTPYAGQVDVVAGGSPCQDLSVAGKRAGLAGARSWLFYELIRAWDETRATYCLWENVDGARSSNKGADLASVLSAFVGAAVAVPRDGWTSAGVVAGATGVAAWRVLDLQHFGPPQRRRRLFVVATRTGGVDPAQVLALSEGVCGHLAPREQQKQGAAQGATDGTGGGSLDNTETAAVPDVVGTLDFGGHGGSYNGQDAYTGRIFPSSGRPRRLTPLECERLMGWPDAWTALGTKEDGTWYNLSDTARYRLCGNGVGAPVAAWIARRLVAEEAAWPIP